MSIALLSLNVYSQTNTFPPSGNVGIGTTSPASLLEVTGAIRATSFSGSGYPYATLIGSGADVSYTEMLAGSTKGLRSVIGIYGGGFSVPNVITFGTAYSERMRINSKGNIGIGTIAPSDRFSVYNKFVVNHGGVLKWGGSADYGLLSWDDGSAIVGGQTNEGLALYANNSEKDRILINGIVLIGKITQSNSTYKLDVGGKIRADEVVVNTTGADFVFAWPGAEIAVMGPEGAANIIFRKEITSSDDPDEMRKKKVQEYKDKFANPYVAASRGYVDAVIEPKETRKILLHSIEVSEHKEISMPAKKFQKKLASILITKRLKSRKRIIFCQLI